MVVAMPRQIQPLVFTAIGDAYGVCFEYAPREILRTRNNLAGYFPHHKYRTGGGRYSDDTQMSIAVAEALLKRGDAASARDFTASFVAACRTGCGRILRRTLKTRAGGLGRAESSSTRWRTF
jgi:ADP-ribosylglycohydrolase